MERRSFVQGPVSSIMIAVLFSCQGQWGLCIPDSWFSPIIRCTTAVWVKWAPEVSVLFLEEKKKKNLSFKAVGQFYQQCWQQRTKVCPSWNHKPFLPLLHLWPLCVSSKLNNADYMSPKSRDTLENPVHCSSEGMLRCANSFCQGWMSFLKEVTWCRNYRVKWHGPCFIIDWTSWSWQSFLL